MNRIFQDLESRLSVISPDPRGELARMAQSVMGLPSDRFLLLFLTGSLPLPTEEETWALSVLVERRISGEPLQYLLGYADFYGRTFAVRPGVLIPRFDTEILVETALRYLTDGASVLDLCAGTGCVGLTLGAERNISVTEVEKYQDAFSVLKENAVSVYPEARLICADVLTDTIDGTYDMILSNPPYIPSEEIPFLSAEVLKEPATALDGGCDGLFFYRILIDRFTPLLKKGGRMLFECGIGQAAAIEEMFRFAGFSDTIRVRDYGGVERVVGAVR